MTLQTALHFINNDYVPSIGGETLEVTNPTTETPAGNAASAQVADVDLAVDAAEKAFPAWSKTSPVARATVLRKFADLLKRDTETLGELESIAMGIPITTFRAMIDRTIAGLYHFAALTLTHLGNVSSEGSPGFMNLAIKQPYGVVAAIIPWNASILILALKLGPAVAAGNTVVAKSSEKSPFASAHVGKLLVEAGFPKGVVNIISGLGHIAGQALAEHMRVRKITFTGSHVVGQKISIAAAKSNLKRVTLELGGKGPSIIFADADLPRAATACAISIARNSGQICTSNTRIYVEESVFEEFTKLYTSKYIAEAQHGDPLKDTTSQGPLVDSIQFNRVMQYVEGGKKTAKVLIGGKRKGEKGYFVEPTVFTEVADDDPLNKEEIFGPVTVVHTFKTEEEAVTRANDSEFGLSSSVYTKDMERALRVAKALEYGQVGINCPNLVAVDLPFGGWKMSGTGRELGPYALDEFLQDKSIYIPAGGI